MKTAALGKLFLATAAFCALALPAHAVVVNAGDVGASGTTSIQGFVDINNQATAIPGLTASLFLEFEGVTNGGLTWNFDYEITNTSSGGTTARLSSFGLGLTPNPTSATSAGPFGFAQVGPGNTLYPNVGGAQNVIDVCFGSTAGTCSGGNGLDNGQSAIGVFTLTFASVLASIDLQTALARFQEIGSGPPYNLSGNASGVGFSNGLNINPVVVNPVPIPGVGAALPLIVGFGGYMGWRKRRKQAAA